MPPVSRPLPRNPKYPTPLLRLKVQDLAAPGAQRFLSSVPVATILQDAVTKVLELLYPTSTNWLPTRSITLVLDSFGGVAYTTGKSLDNDHKEIHFSVEYIASIAASAPTRVCDEITGVIVHEVVHCWQRDGHGTCPGGLIEGIADWVRLKAGHKPPHWKQQQVNMKWDQGYEVTAFFLEWLETRSGAPSVLRINEALKDAEYQEDGFWRGLFGVTVDTLWNEYGQFLKEEEDRESAKNAQNSNLDNTAPRDHNIAGDGAAE